MKKSRVIRVNDSFARLLKGIAVELDEDITDVSAELAQYLRNNRTEFKNFNNVRLVDKKKRCFK